MKNYFFIGIVIVTLFSCKTSVENKLPTDSQATPETVVLYNRLFNLAEKGIMLGHQDSPLYGMAMRSVRTLKIWLETIPLCSALN